MQCMVLENYALFNFRQIICSHSTVERNGTESVQELNAMKLHDIPFSMLYKPSLQDSFQFSFLVGRSYFLSRISSNFFLSWNPIIPTCSFASSVSVMFFFPQLKVFHYILRPGFKYCTSCCGLFCT